MPDTIISNMEKFSSVTILLELLLHHLTLITKHYINTRKYKEARPAIIIITRKQVQIFTK